VINLERALGDTAATLLEWRDRGRWERVVLGSVPVDVVDIAWWLNVLRYISWGIGRHAQLRSRAVYGAWTL
jgi:hypothetical protein